MNAGRQVTRYERDGSVAVLTLDRPDQLNAMNAAMRREIADAVSEADADTNVRVLVVHGAGRAFSSGFDLKEQMASGISGTAAWREVLWEEFAMTMSVWHARMVTIAAVHGPCVAGGMELAMACDITVASEDAQFGEPEVKFGAGVVTMILPWLVGPKKAKEIILMGLDRILAEEACRIGVVNRVVAPGEHLSSALKMAHHVSAMDPILIEQMKRAINRTTEIMGLSEALQACLDMDLHIESEGSPDKRKFFEIARAEGMRAALAWRESRFT